MSRYFFGSGTALNYQWSNVLTAVWYVFALGKLCINVPNAHAHCQGMPSPPELGLSVHGNGLLANHDIFMEKRPIFCFLNFIRDSGGNADLSH